MKYDLFVSCPKGLEYLLEAELVAMGLVHDKTTPQGVYGSASLALIYHICLWSRLANRVQLILFTGTAHNESLILKLCQSFAWQTVFSAHQSFAISFHGQNDYIRNTMYGAQVVKDGIADYFKLTHGARPKVDKSNPDIRLHAYLKGDQLTLSFDLSGQSLHQRAYRHQQGEAPLKENLAAALLIRAGWPELAAQGKPFYDLFCGSGTLVIEAAMMAAQLAPGLLRTAYGFEHWARHDDSLWQRTKKDALQAVKPLSNPLVGSDINPQVIEYAKQNAKRAGVADFVRFEVADLGEGVAVAAEPGLVICNPPYGERLGDLAPLIRLYQLLGKRLHEDYPLWRAGILTGNPMLAKAVGLRAHKKYAFYNGAIPCEFYLFELDETNRLKSEGVSSDAVNMLVNRLNKNAAHLEKWARRTHTEAYRLYDADIPEYACALDRYGEYLVFQEYLPPKTVSPNVAEKRRVEMIQAIIQATNINPDKLIIKQRQQQKGTSQYERTARSNEMLSVKEGQATLLVNLKDYIDTGLFLDHRPIRLRFEQLKPKTRFLNLFCYTATASVHAAIAGAITTNVDLSNTYLRWAENNFKANRMDVRKHQFIASDVSRWLSMAKPDQTYDVIFLDPPSFSNSKRMENTLDIQRDHVPLIQAAMRLLSKEGTLYFSTNFKRFKLDTALEARYKVKEITPSTIDEDFKRRPKMHRCYTFTHTEKKAS